MVASVKIVVANTIRARTRKHIEDALAVKMHVT